MKISCAQTKKRQIQFIADKCHIAYITVCMSVILGCFKFDSICTVSLLASLLCNSMQCIKTKANPIAGKTTYVQHLTYRTTHHHDSWAVMRPRTKGVRYLLASLKCNRTQGIKTKLHTKQNRDTNLIACKITWAGISCVWYARLWFLARFEAKNEA